MSSKRFLTRIIPSGGIILALFFFFIYASAETVNTSKPSVARSNTELINYIDKYNLLIFNINHQLRTNSYKTIVDYSISSDEKIELQIKVNQEVIKKTKEKITQIVIDTIKKNEFDPASFHINVTGYDQPFQKTDTTSTRLSYNDLIGYIGEKLFVKYNIAFSLQHKFLPENINITLDLPTNYRTHNVEIQNTIFDIIKQHNFDSSLFQIDITNNIKN